MSSPNLVTQRALAAMDGEWQRQSRLVEALMAVVPPGKALRSSRAVTDVSQERAIQSGARQVARHSVESLVKSGRAERMTQEDGTVLVRLTALGLSARGDQPPLQLAPAAPVVPPPPSDDIVVMVAPALQSARASAVQPGLGGGFVVDSRARAGVEELARAFEQLADQLEMVKRFVTGDLVGQVNRILDQVNTEFRKSETNNDDLAERVNQAISSLVAKTNENMALLISAARPLENGLGDLSDQLEVLASEAGDRDKRLAGFEARLRAMEERLGEAGRSLITVKGHDNGK